MASKNTKLTIEVEQPVYKIIQKLARKDETTVSKKIKSLLLEALELYEDLGLSIKAEKRESSLKNDMVSHQDAW